MKKLFLTMMTMLMVVIMGLSFAACDPDTPDDPNKPIDPIEPSGKVKVEVDCGANGSYTIEPASSDGYEAGTKIKLTIVPDDGYEIGTVKEDDIYDITKKVLTAGGQKEEDPGERVYEFDIYKDKKFAITFQTEGTRLNKSFHLSVNISQYDTKLGSVSVEPVKEDYSRNDEITITASLASDNATAGRFFVYDQSFASELNENRTISKKVTVTDDLTIDVFFDDWTKETELNISKMKNLDEFYNIINQELVLVDYSATNCDPCKNIAPAIESFSKLGLAKVVSFNVAPNGDLIADEKVDELRVFSFPTVIAYSYGKELKWYVCKDCNPISGKENWVQKNDSGIEVRVLPDNLQANSFVLTAGDCPEKCPKCGKANMEELVHTDCRNCGARYGYNYISNAPTKCTQCNTSIRMYSTNSHRMVGQFPELVIGTASAKNEYLCKFVGLDPNLLG